LRAEKIRLNGVYNIMSKCIMIQGTASSVGKSLITAGLCRVFKQDGYKVAPFKSQNMALNSFITKEGREMGRAQVVQAEAAGLEPLVEMNPILIKPTADTKAQIIINGDVYGNLTAMEYHNLKPKLREMISGIYKKLVQKNDIVVIEGAGSPAEINLRENDIVNMGMAEIADAPVILVGDIDKGGVFASLAGTMLLLNEDEKKRIKGVIINKFRGDYEILKPGIKMLEDIIKIPVLGVLPYLDINIDDEDGFLAEKYEGKRTAVVKDIDIAVIRLPHISNDTDFNVLDNVPGVNVRYVGKLLDMLKPDMVIIPGTKNTIEDLLFIRDSGLEEEIIRLNANGIPVFGICGGYQMLGTDISDPQYTESSIVNIKGMGLLNASTVFQAKKTMTRVEAGIVKGYGIMDGLEDCKISGYEIHMGTTDFAAGCIPYLIINNVLGEKETKIDGLGNEAGNVFGTYIHGIFDSFDFTVGLINNLRKRKGLNTIDNTIQPLAKYKEEQYDKLADMLRKHLDIGKVYEIIDKQEIEVRSQNSEYYKR
jgi:adenosylcobyric acid synthase